MAGVRRAVRERIVAACHGGAIGLQASRCTPWLDSRTEGRENQCFSANEKPVTIWSWGIQSQMKDSRQRVWPPPQPLGCLFILIAFLATLALPILYLEYQRSLPNGYKVIYLSGSTAGISSPTGEAAVRYGVQDWKIARSKVYGRLDNGQWYVLDTKTGTCTYVPDRDTAEGLLQKVE
jgi:hypothetical protein